MTRALTPCISVVTVLLTRSLTGSVSSAVSVGRGGLIRDATPSGWVVRKSRGTSRFTRQEMGDILILPNWPGTNRSLRGHPVVVSSSFDVSLVNRDTATRAH